jgi:hypothetical protein
VKVDINNMLDRVAEIMTHKAKIEHPYREAIANLEEGMKSDTQSLDMELTYLKQQIEEIVLEQGSTMRSDKMMAVYYKGKVSWDSKLLEGLALAYPEIEKCRSFGKPYVQYREVKKNDSQSE